VADGDGMTRPAEECAYAPRKTTWQALAKPRETEAVMAAKTGENN
jgi:hypothetical protein